MSVIGSIVANISASTEALARDMDRGVMIVEQGFARMNKIAAGGFVEGNNVKGMESSLAKIYGSGSGGGNAIVEAAGKTGAKAGVELSEKFKFSFEKSQGIIDKLFGSDDLLTKVGGVGLAFGGWGLAFNAAAGTLSMIVPLMDRILSGTKVNTEAAKEYADAIDRIAARSNIQGPRGTNAIAAMFNGTGRLQDEFDYFARRGDMEGYEGPDTLKSMIEDRKATLRKSLDDLGSQDDYVRAKLQHTYGTSHANTVAEYNQRADPFIQQFQQQRAGIEAQLKQIADLQIDANAAAMRLAPEVGGAAAGFLKNTMRQSAGARGASAAENASNGIGDYLNRYFELRQDSVANDPFANFSKANEQITRDLNAGLINEGQANVMRARARQGLDSALPAMQPQFASLIQANSAEASKAILSAMLPKVRPEDRPLKELKAEAEKQTKQLERIGDKIKNEFQVANF